MRRESRRRAALGRRSAGGARRRTPCELLRHPGAPRPAQRRAHAQRPAGTGPQRRRHLCPRSPQRAAPCVPLCPPVYFAMSSCPPGCLGGRGSRARRSARRRRGPPAGTPPACLGAPRTLSLRNLDGRLEAWQPRRQLCPPSLGKGCVRPIQCPLPRRAPHLAPILQSHCLSNRIALCANTLELAAAPRAARPEAAARLAPRLGASAGHFALYLPCNGANQATGQVTAAHLCICVETSAAEVLCCEERQ